MTVGTDSCGHNSHSSPDEKCPLGSVQGCLWALDMKMERGEGGAHVMSALLSLMKLLPERL